METYLRKKPSSIPQGHILVVDDDTVNQLKLSQSLQEEGHKVDLAQNGEQALEIAQSKVFDLVILDVLMPGIDGFETCRRLKANPVTREVPVIFMTALTDTEDKLLGFEIGAVDYITKPVQQEELVARVNTHLRIRALTQSLEVSYANEQKRRKLSDTLREVAKIVSITLQQEQVLDLILTQLERVVTYHRASITLLTGDMLTMAAGRDKENNLTKKITIPVDQYPLNALALQQKQPIFVPDVQKDSRWQTEKTASSTRSFINAPLLVQDRPIGLLGVGRSDEIPYTNDDAQTVFAFALQVAIAVENARLVEQTKIALRETEGLFKGAQAILSSTELPEICQNLAIQLKNLVQADQVVIYLVNHQERMITFSTSYGDLILDEKTMSYRELEAGISGLVFQSGQPILSTEADDGLEPTATLGRRQRAGIGAIIVLPLVSRNRVIGTATVMNRIAQRRFNAHDVDLLMALTNQAATVIENIRLYTLAQQELAERRRAEAALQQANKELTKLNADKDKFFSIMAHDLKGPFMPLLGNAQLLAEETEDFTSEDIKLMAGSMYRSTKRVLDLLEDILQWARLQMGRIEYRPDRINLTEIVIRNIELLQDNAVYKNITLKNELTEKLFVYADAYMIDMVLRNLISNALKFTPTAGQVTILARTTKQTGSPELVEVSISDTGVGISQADIEKLFKIDVHHSTPGTADEEGTGLGLIMCHEMIKQNGGDIWVESEVGRGTIFTFTVPLAKTLSVENSTAPPNLTVSEKS